jgi:hypothetical protein
MLAVLGHMTHLMMQWFVSSILKREQGASMPIGGGAIGNEIKYFFARFYVRAYIVID